MNDQDVSRPSWLAFDEARWWFIAPGEELAGGLVEFAREVKQWSGVTETRLIGTMPVIGAVTGDPHGLATRLVVLAYLVGETLFPGGAVTVSCAAIAEDDPACDWASNSTLAVVRRRTEEMSVRVAPGGGGKTPSWRLRFDPTAHVGGEHFGLAALERLWA